MEYIYVLKCQKDKYFIGKTYNVQIEYNEHLDGTFCDLTKEFKPYEIECIFELVENNDLDIVISKYILKYSKDNIFFIEGNKKEIKKLIKKNNNNCICNSKEHWLINCNLNNKQEFWAKMFMKVFNKINDKFKKVGFCHRCGREGHESNECFAKKHIDGYTISEDDENDFLD